MKKIGLIGFGFLGKSLAHVFGNDNEILYFSLSEKNAELEQIAKDCEFIFICLPTPMKVSNGECDLSIVDSVLNQLNELKPEGVIIIRSTMPPGSTRKFNEKYKDLKIIFNPEFLTERSYLLDAVNPARIILGGDREYVSKAVELYSKRFKNARIIITGSDEAELIKYAANVFFAMKVIYFNIIYQICEELDLNYDIIIEGIISDGRIADSHCFVPGHDGNRGFSGSCFPKDINAFYHFLEDIDLKDEEKFIKNIWELNLKYRPNKDWLNIPSAVAKDK